MPASAGVHGPGEITIASGARTATSSIVQRVVAPNVERRAQLTEVLHEVVRERVVVVDDEDHGHGRG